MVKIKRVEEAPSKKSGGSKPDGDYKFYVLEASLKVETINIPQYGGEKRFDDFEIVANEVSDESPNRPIEEIYAELDGKHRTLVSVVLRCEGPAIIPEYKDSLWQTPKGVYKYRQFLEAIGLDKDGEYDPNEFEGKQGTAYMKNKPNREGKIFLEAAMYHHASDQPDVEVVEVAEDDVPF
tara:strand:+ start:1615 stop:2154 length:540 start_codon:yes stop_codon:yes gene_type:complete